MELMWPLTDGRVTMRPAVGADAQAFLDYKRRPECQAYVARTVDTLEQSQALIAEWRTEPDSLLCAVLLAGRVVGDIRGRRDRPESLGPEPDVHDFHLEYSVHTPTPGAAAWPARQSPCSCRCSRGSVSAGSSRRPSPTTSPRSAS